MAERLETMPVKRIGHNWAEWSDGSVWRVRKGVDFTCGVESFRTQLYGKARSLNKGVELVIEGDTVTFRLFNKPAAD